MRSDRYELLQATPQLLGIAQALFNLPPIALGEFKSIIEGPARRNDTANAPPRLPAPTIAIAGFPVMPGSLADPITQ